MMNFFISQLIMQGGISMQKRGGLLAFSEGSKAQSLFHSEGYFWLTTAVSVSFAAEELSDAQTDKLQSQQILALFNQCIRHNAVSAAALATAKQIALDNIAIIDHYNDQQTFFKAAEALRLCRCFTTYWLFFKLIEMEWQEVLQSDEVAETYQFMDTVISESEELLSMKEILDKGKRLNNDQEIYLRQNWRSVRQFWRDMKQDLYLLDKGFLKYQQL